MGMQAQPLDYSRRIPLIFRFSHNSSQQAQIGCDENSVSFLGMLTSEFGTSRDKEVHNNERLVSLG